MLLWDDLGEELVVLGGDFSPEAEGVFSRSLAQEVVRHVFDGGEVCGRVFGSDATFVIAKDYVQDPMQAVLDGPVALHDRAQLFGRQL